MNKSDGVIRLEAFAKSNPALIALADEEAVAEISELAPSPLKLEFERLEKEFGVKIDSDEPMVSIPLCFLSSIIARIVQLEKK